MIKTEKSRNDNQKYVVQTHDTERVSKVGEGVAHGGERRKKKN